MGVMLPWMKNQSDFSKEFLFELVRGDRLMARYLPANSTVKRIKRSFLSYLFT
jgi:hypothetical protein